jgi:hypothetical protein
MAEAVLAVALLGAFHGLNPGMGWLWAVFLALQRAERRLLLTALVPIVAGHAAAVAVVAAVLLGARSVVPLGPLRVGTALLLLAFGVYRWRQLGRHGRWVGLKVGWRDLFGWSLLVATAHGSGWMLAPVLLGASDAGANLALLGVHLVVLLATMAVAARVVHDWLGVAVLRRVWINFDLLWAAGLVAAGVLALVAALGGTHAHGGVPGG